MSESAVEELITDNDTFFESLISHINESKKTIDCEVYIIRNDDIGERIFQALTAAANRGVKVRLLVDGVGSLPWINDYCLPSERGGTPPSIQQPAAENLTVRIYHPTPFSSQHFKFFDLFKSTSKAILRLNRRNHKKLTIVDGHYTFAGSHNFWTNSLIWNEVGVQLEGHCDPFQASFDSSWQKGSSINAHRQQSPRTAVSKRAHSLARTALFKRAANKKYDSVQSNHNYRARRQFLKQLIGNIKHAEKRIWLVTPYFVPPNALLRNLCAAASSGKDVRIVLPLQNDHPFMKVAARYYYPKLLACGARIYEYEPTMLHAKLFLVDDWAAIGSTNLNHRSFFYDLELLVTLTNARSRNGLCQLMEDMFRRSQLIDQDSGFNLKFLSSCLGLFVLMFRKWI